MTKNTTFWDITQHLRRVMGSGLVLSVPNTSVVCLEGLEVVALYKINFLWRKNSRFLAKNNGFYRFLGITRLLGGVRRSNRFWLKL